MTNSQHDTFDPFARPSDQDRAHCRADLINRVRCVQRRGWEPYRRAWSTGEVVAVALLLNDATVLHDFDETEATVYGRYSFDLWGLVDGRADEVNGLVENRRWFADTARELYLSTRPGSASPDSAD